LKKNKSAKNRVNSPDHTVPDVSADKTGIDNDADKTVKRNKSIKSKLEVDPDSTGIDTGSDKTKKEKPPGKQKNK